MKTMKEIISDLKKANDKVEEYDVIIKSIKDAEALREGEVSLTINQEIPVFRKNDAGNYVETKTRRISDQQWVIAEAMMNNVRMAALAEMAKSDLQVMNEVLSYAEVHIIGVLRPANIEFKSPFKDDGVARQYDHDQWTYYITSIEPSEIGKESIAIYKQILWQQKLAQQASGLADKRDYYKNKRNGVTQSATEAEDETLETKVEHKDEEVVTE